MSKRTAIAISGSGAGVIVATAYLKALVDLKIEFSHVVASSSGAVPAAFLCSGQIDTLYQFMLKIMDHDVFKLNLFNLFGKLSIMSNDPLKKTIHKMLDFMALKYSGKKCLVTTTNLLTWETVFKDICRLGVWDDVIVNDIVESGAIPFLFPLINQTVDGGLLDNYLPFSAIAPDIDRVIWIIPSTATPGPVKGFVSLGKAAILLLLWAQCVQAKRAIRALHPNIEIIELQPQAPTGVGLVGFSDLGTTEQRQAILDTAYNYAYGVLSKLD